MQTRRANATKIKSGVLQHSKADSSVGSTHAYELRSRKVLRAETDRSERCKRVAMRSVPAERKISGDGVQSDLDNAELLSYAALTGQPQSRRTAVSGVWQAESLRRFFFFFFLLELAAMRDRAETGSPDAGFLAVDPKTSSL